MSDFIEPLEPVTHESELEPVTPEGEEVTQLEPVTADDDSETSEPEGDAPTALDETDVHNLRMELTESDIGQELLVAVDDPTALATIAQSGEITPELREKALEAGLTPEQIEGFVAHAQATVQQGVQKIYSDAGLSTQRATDIVQYARANFSPEEIAIFERESYENPVQSLKTLDAYLRNEGLL